MSQISCEKKSIVDWPDDPSKPIQAPYDPNGLKVFFASETVSEVEVNQCTPTLSVDLNKPVIPCTCSNEDPHPTKALSETSHSPCIPCPKAQPCSCSPSVSCVPPVTCLSPPESPTQPPSKAVPCTDSPSRAFIQDRLNSKTRSKSYLTCSKTCKACKPSKPVVDFPEKPAYPIYNNTSAPDIHHKLCASKSQPSYCCLKPACACQTDPFLFPHPSCYSQSDSNPVQPYCYPPCQYSYCHPPHYCKCYCDQIPPPKVSPYAPGEYEPHPIIPIPDAQPEDMMDYG